MRRLLLIFAATLAFAQSGGIRLSDADHISVLELQRSQNRLWAQREAAHAEMLQTEAGVRFLQADIELQKANFAFGAKQDELRKRLGCAECRLVGDELLFMKLGAFEVRASK